MSADTNPADEPKMTAKERRAYLKEGKKNAKQWQKADPGDGIPITMHELGVIAREDKLTPKDGAKFRKALLALRERKRTEGEEIIQSLSFDQVWKEFQARKIRFTRKHKKRPTGVVIGQIEATIFANHKEILEGKKMIRTEKGQGQGMRLFVNNMWAVVSDQQSCIAPFFVDLDQTREENPYQDC